MTFEVVWSMEAQRTYREVLVDLASKWTYKEVEAFIDRTELVQSYLGKFPRMYAYSASQRAYRALIHPTVSLFYTVDDQKGRIELISFWYNRQNPMI